MEEVFKNLRKEKLIAIVGPTAVGKSKLSVMLAKDLDGEVISADSVQVYRGLNIGSAKITHEEMQGIPHHLIDCYGPETNYNISMFRSDARSIINDINSRGKLPILCGGSGLYVNSLINDGYDIENSTAYNPGKRKEWLDLEEKRGSGTLYAILSDKYPNRAKKIHANDLHRIIRALEMNEDITENEIQLWTSPYNLSVYGLTMQRDELYRSIESRVDDMFERGLVKEVQNLLNTGYKESSNAMMALGYKEIIPYLKGEESLEEAKNTIKKNTRHFAKRQITWFKRDPRIKWFSLDKYSLKDIKYSILDIENSK